MARLWRPSSSSSTGDRVRLTVEVPAGEVQHAVEHATHDLAERVKVPGFRAGKVPPAGARLADRQGSASTRRRSSRTSRAGSGAPRATNRVRPSELPAFSYELPTGDDAGLGVHAPSSRCRAPVEPADWTKLEVPRLEVEVDDEVVDAELEALQETVASLSPVEGRPARAGRRRRRRHRLRGRARPARLRRRARRRAARRRDRGRASASSLPGESQRGRLGARRRHDPLRRRVTLKELYEKVLPPLDDEPRARGLGVRHARRAARRASRSGSASCSRRRPRAASAPDAVDELVKAIERRAGRARRRGAHARAAERVPAPARVARHRPGRLPADGRASAAPSSSSALRAEAAQSIGARARARGRRRQARDRGLATTTSAPSCARSGESDEEIEEFIAAGGADRVRARPAPASARSTGSPPRSSRSPRSSPSARERIWTPGKEGGRRPRRNCGPPAARTKEWCDEPVDPDGRRADLARRARVRHLLAPARRAHRLPRHPRRRPDREPHDRPAPAPRVGRSRQGHLPLHQLAGRLGVRRASRSTTRCSSSSPTCRRSASASR